MNVSCRVTIGGRSMTASKTKTILDPNPIVNYTSVAGKVGFKRTAAPDPVRAGGPNPSPDPTIVGVFDGDHTGHPWGLPGTIFNNDFTSLVTDTNYDFDSEGFWQFVQMVEPSRQVVTAAGSTDLLNKNGRWLLDTSYPYTIGWATGSGPQSTDDAPSSGLVSLLFVQFSTTTGTGTADQFKMYCMFQPPGAGAQYVATKVVPWNWSCTANYDAPSGNWSIAGGSTCNTTNNAVVVPNGVQPVWTDNARGLAFNNLLQQPSMRPPNP
jgi:hypothetical protein